MQTTETKINPEMEKELQQILKQCEKDLLEMALLQTGGGPLREKDFETPIFRFIWLKLTEPLRKRGEFYRKGIRY